MRRGERRAADVGILPERCENPRSGGDRACGRGTPSRERNLEAPRHETRIRN